jgi:hypothetical protein
MIATASLGIIPKQINQGVMMNDTDVDKPVREIVGKRYKITNHNGVNLVEKKESSRFLKWIGRAAALGMIGAQAVMPAYGGGLDWTAADETAHQEGRLELKGEKDLAPPKPKATLEEKVDKENGWFAVGQMGTYFSPLKESEKQISTIDDIGYSLFPDWKRLTTFSDWRDKGMLSDSGIGIGRDFGKKWLAFIDFGGGYGQIKNHNRYGLIKTEIDFARSNMYGELTLQYFPWGKPEGDFDKQGFFANMLDGFKHAKVSLGVIGGFSHQGSYFHANIKGLCNNKIVGVRINDTADILYVGPNITIHTPLTPKIDTYTSIGITFNEKQKSELNSPFIISGIMYRF